MEDNNTQPDEASVDTQNPTTDIPPESLPQQTQPSGQIPEDSTSALNTDDLSGLVLPVKKSQQQQEQTQEEPQKLTWDNPRVVDAQAKAESSYNPLAVGPMTRVGTAKGKFQIIDSTWDQYAKPGENKWNPEDSQKVRDRYMSFLSDHYKGDLNLSLAAYNWGEGNLDKLIKSRGTSDFGQLTEARPFDTNMPLETKKYVEKIMQTTSATSPVLASKVQAATKKGMLGVQDFAQLLLPISSTPEFQSLSTPDKIKTINQIYSKHIVSDDVKPVLKELADTLWEGATPEELYDLNASFGRPSKDLMVTAKDPVKTLDAWKASKLQELNKAGIPSELISAPFDAHFNEVKNDELEASAVRNRGFIGRFAHYVWQGGIQAAKSTSLEPLAEGTAYISHLLADNLGAPDYSTTIAKLPDTFLKPDRDTQFETDDKGYLLLNEDGSPREKWQMNAFRLTGNMLGMIVGGAGLKAAGAGTTTTALGIGAVNALQIASGTFNSVYAATGSKEKAYNASFMAMPVAELTSALELSYLNNYGSKYVAGLSLFNQAKLFAKTAAFNTVPKGVITGLTQDELLQQIEMSQTGQQPDINRVLASGVTMGIVGGAIGAATSLAERSQAMKNTTLIKGAVVSKLQDFQNSHASELKLRVSPDYVPKEVIDTLGMTSLKTADGEVTVTKNNFVPDESTSPQEALKNVLKGFTPDEVMSMHRERATILEELKKEPVQAPPTISSKEPTRTFENGKSFLTYAGDNEGQPIILTMHTEPAERGQGKGSALLEAFKEKMQKEGFNKISLESIPDEGFPQERLDNFYKRHGFEKTGEGTEFNIKLKPSDHTALLNRLETLDEHLRGTDSPDYFNKVKANEADYIEKTKNDPENAQMLPIKWDETRKTWVNTQSGADHPFLRGALGLEERGSPIQDILEARSKDAASVTQPYYSDQPQARPQKLVSNNFTKPIPYNLTNQTPTSPKEAIKELQKLTAVASKATKESPSTLKEGGRMNKNTLGYHNFFSGVTKVRSLRDIPTLLHEKIHEIDRFLNNVSLDTARKDPRLSAALNEQADTFYPGASKLDPDTKLREGFTTFAENLLTNQPVHKDLLDWWNNTFSKEHPEIYNQYGAVKKAADLYYSQTPEARMEAFVNPKPASFWEKMKDTVSKVETWRGLGDKDYAFKQADQVLGTTGVYNNKAFHSFINAQDVSNVEHARNLVLGDRYRDINGNFDPNQKTLKKIFEGLTAEQQDALKKSLVAHNALMMIERGQNAGQGLETFKAYLDAFKNRPDAALLNKRQNDVYQWWQRTVDDLVSRSPSMQRSIAAVRKSNLEMSEKVFPGQGAEHGYYVPTFREGAGEPTASTFSQGNETAPNPIRGRRGSDLPLKNIFDSFEKLATEFSSAGLRNQLYDNLRRALQNGLSVGGLMERVPVHMEKKYQSQYENILEQTLAGIRKEADKQSLLSGKTSKGIREAGKEFTSLLAKASGLGDEGLLKTAIQFFSPETSLSPKTASKGYMILALPDVTGKKMEFYEVHPDVLKAFTGVERNALIDSMAFDLLYRTPKRLLQAGATSLNSVFQARNFLVKDWQTYLLTKGKDVDVNGEKKGISALGFARHLFSEIGDQIITQSTGRSTGAAAFARDMGFNTATMAGAARELEYVASKNGMTSTVIDATHKAIRGLEFVASLGENATRLAAMKAVADAKGIKFDGKEKLTQTDLIDLALAYKYSTINFSKRGGGAVTTFLREAVPFYGARVAGLDQSITASIENPKRAMKLASASFAIGLISYLNNHKKDWYDDLSEQTKATSVVVDLDNKKMMAFPLDDYNAVFHSLGVVAAKQFVDTTDNEASTISLLREALQKTSPIDLPADKAGSLGFASTPLGPLARSGMEQLTNEIFWQGGRPIVDEKKFPTEQYSPKTAELFKEIGRLTGMSPDRLEFFVSTYLAGPVKAEKFAEKQLGIKPVNEDEGTNLIARAFMREASNAAIQDQSRTKFYAAQAEAIQNKFQETETQGMARKQITRIGKQITELNKQIMVEEDKDKRDALYLQRRELEKKGSSLWRNPDQLLEPEK